MTSIQQPTKRKIILEQTRLEAGQRLAIVARLQQQSNWCWAACIEMATDFKGNPRAQCNVANDGFGRTDCCHPVGNSPVNPACNILGATGLIVQLCINYGYAHTRLVFSALTVGQIANQIYGNHPVYASIQWFQGGTGHIVLIKGWDIDAQNVAWVYYNDPATGARVSQLLTLVAGWGFGTWNESIVDM